MRKSFVIIALSVILLGCSQQQPKVANPGGVNFINQLTVEKVTGLLIERNGSDAEFRIKRGVAQVAGLWRESDGPAEEFEIFCLENFVADDTKLESLFAKIERNMEIFSGYFHKMDVRLKEPLHLEGPEPEPVDIMFGGYNPSAHLTEDLFSNKIAFLTALNFPFFSLKEKMELGAGWSRRQWAYARMGDMFTSRVPAEVIQHVSRTLTAADSYISDYNIFMDKLVTQHGETLFPEGMKLISHWGLRDELKSNYATEGGLEKQRMIYQVMQRIIDQSIPVQVINKGDYMWEPFGNKLVGDGAEVQPTPETEKRYEVLLANFHAMKAIDGWSPNYPTYISRAFEQNMEILQEDVERLFTEFVSSPQVKIVAGLISERLGRPLEPFDIWYNGFKAAGAIQEDKLTAITQAKYPSAEALRKDIPSILQKLGWAKPEAERIASLITVDASRGAGHAWGAAMRNDIAHLRTRVGPNGLDYKGYNIAIHELGHCVEQTITLNDVDYYMLNGVPNTAFTEAMAFLFQKRDIELLGVAGKDENKSLMRSLDNFWANYEIMGVSLVDMKVWNWLYENPDATAEQLKEQVIAIAREVWNNYYAGILGGKDQTLLAIYSHMIDNPLYLSNYPLGHVIDFQIEQFIQDKSFAHELTRMFTQGRIVPQLWMTGAVGNEISIAPILAKVDGAR